jgi:hypothetical protein
VPLEKLCVGFLGERFRYEVAGSGGAFKKAKVVWGWPDGLGNLGRLLISTGFKSSITIGDDVRPTEREFGSKVVLKRKQIKTGKSVNKDGRWWVVDVEGTQPLAIALRRRIASLGCSCFASGSSFSFQAEVTNSSYWHYTITSTIKSYTSYFLCLI